MKRILILAFAGIIQIAIADKPIVIDYPETYDLIFHSLAVDTSQISNAFCDTIESKWTKLGNWCEAYPNYVAYNSPADETVYFESFFSEDSSLKFLLHRESQTCSSGVAIGTSGSLPFSEVLSIELFRMQSFGILKNSQDSLSSLLEKSIHEMKTVGGCEDIDLVLYEEGSYSSSILGNNNSCCSLVDTSTSILKISPMIGNVRIEKISAGKFQIHGVPAGTAYAVFNLNGQLISKGFVENGLLEVPVERAVLKIGSKWFEL